MKPVRIILVGLICGFVSTVHADIASVQWVRSIVQSIEPTTAVQADWNQTVTTAADYIKNKPTLGTAASASANDFATAAQGALAASAVQPGDLAAVATSGSYNDLSNKPTIPAAQVNSDWNATSGVAQILNKPTLGTAASASANDFATAAQGALAASAVQPGDLAAVATSGSYNDLTNKPTIPAAQVNSDWNATSGVAQILNKPTIPTVNDATLTIQKNGTAVDTFTANASTNKTINITVPTTAADVNAVPTTRTVNGNALSSNVTLDGADIAVTGYTKPASTSAIAATDTVNAAIGKLEAALDGKQASGNYVPTTTTVNGHALSSNVTVTKSDVGLSNVQNVDQTNAANITSGTMDVARLPVGTTATTVAVGNDGRFDTVPTTQPSGTPPTGRVFIWFN